MAEYKGIKLLDGTDFVVDKVKKSKWKHTYAKILSMAEQGLPTKKIAHELKISRATVWRVMRKTAFTEKLTEREKDVIEKARKLFELKALKAAQKICSLAEHGTPKQRLQFEAAKEVLYQIGMKPVEVVETRKRDYTVEEVQSALEVAKEVEAVSERLADKNTDFLLHRVAVPTPTAQDTLLAPVTAGAAEAAEEDDADAEPVETGTD